MKQAWLHIQKALDVCAIPDNTLKFPNHQFKYNRPITQLIDCDDSHKIYKWSISSKQGLTQNSFSMVNVLSGSGEIVINDKKYNIKGDAFIILQK